MLLRIDREEVDTLHSHDFCVPPNRNFLISTHFRIKDLTDSFLKIFPQGLEYLRGNQLWGSRPHNILNLKRLCYDVLEPVNTLAPTKIDIILGLVTRELGDIFGLNMYNSLRFGKGAIFHVRNINNLKVFLKIVGSNIEYGEIVYYSEEDMIYIDLPTVTLNKIVRIR